MWKLLSNYFKIYKVVKNYFRNRNPKYRTYKYGDLEVTLIHNPMFDE